MSAGFLIRPRPAVTVVALSTLASAFVAHAQCSPQWRPGPGEVGMNAEAWNMIHWDADGAGPNPPLLVVGGTFTTAGGQTVNHIAAWDGVNWHALGAGVNNDVRTLAVLPSTNELVVGGDFTTAGGAPALYLAKWNGTTWSPLGGGVNNIVTGLTVLPSGQLFVAGNFTVVGGTVASTRSAIWTGTAWQNLAAGAPARDLIVAPTGIVYAGGAYNSGSSPNILQWTGPAPGTWTGVGGGLGGCYGLATEYCLFGRRGKLAATSRIGRNWFDWKRPYENGYPKHSAKPPGFLELVEQISDGPRLEMFARESRLGWDSWGDESLNHVELSA